MKAKALAAALLFAAAVPLRADQNEDMIEKCKKDVAANPQNALAHHNWGIALLNLSKPAEAIPKFEKAAQLRPDYEPTYASWGMALGHYKVKRYDEAIKKFEKAVALNPNSGQAYFDWGYVLLNRSSMKDRTTAQSLAAMEKFEKAIELDFGWWAQDKWGLTLLDVLNNREFGLALERYYKAVANASGDHAQAYGREAMFKGDWSSMMQDTEADKERAWIFVLDVCRKHLELYPNDAYALSNWGKALNDLKKWGEATEKLKRAVELDPKLASAHRELGLSYLPRGILQEAKESFQKATELDPKDWQAYFNWGEAFTDPAEAVEKYAKAVEIHPFGKAYAQWGAALNKLGRYEEAIEKFDKGASLTPKDPALLRDWGIALSRSGKPAEAAEKLARAAELDPKDIDAHAEWAVALAAAGRSKEAIEKSQKALSLALVVAQAPRAHVAWGKSILQLNGSPEEASEHFRLAAQNSHSDLQKEAFALWGAQLSRLLEEGRADAAIAEYRKAAKPAHKGDDGFFLEARPRTLEFRLKKPDDPGGWLFLGTIDSPVSLYAQDAANELEHYLKLAPQAPNAAEVRQIVVELTAKARRIAGSVLVPGATYLMGSYDRAGHEDGSEYPQHTSLVDAFYIDKHVVTADQYAEFCRATGRPAPAAAGNLPATGLSWHDADAYCKWAGQRLPTEAEWELAARGKLDSENPWAQRFFWGPDEKAAGKYAWYKKNSKKRPHPVGEKLPNALGLYDMSGNAWQWVSDWWDPKYYEYGRHSGINDAGPAAGTLKVKRGGSYADEPDDLRVARRKGEDPAVKSDVNGCRCAMSQ